MTTTISFQPELRLELLLVGGPKECQEQRSLFIRLDELLDMSNVEHRLSRKLFIGEISLVSAP